MGYHPCYWKLTALSCIVLLATAVVFYFQGVKDGRAAAKKEMINVSIQEDSQSISENPYD